MDTSRPARSAVLVIPSLVPSKRLLITVAIGVAMVTDGEDVVFVWQPALFVGNTQLTKIDSTNDGAVPHVHLREVKGHSNYTVLKVTLIKIRSGNTLRQ